MHFIVFPLTKIISTIIELEFTLTVFHAVENVTLVFATVLDIDSYKMWLIITVLTSE
jgi:hypothetical protein